MQDLDENVLAQPALYGYPSYRKTEGGASVQFSNAAVKELTESITLAEDMFVMAMEAMDNMLLVSLPKELSV